MKECIRCGNTEKDIRSKGIKDCYAGWGSKYERHDYRKGEDIPNNLIKI